MPENKLVRGPSLEVPILFLVFNRPDTTGKVFQSIREARPKRLYVACDGPRDTNGDDEASIAKVQSIVECIDWPCDLKKLYRKKNLGCKIAVSNAIDWFFDSEEEGIILEDDCLPHPEFFDFCKVLLERYRKNDSVTVITGNNFQGGIARGSASYYFSKYNHCWGWACWRRSWSHYNGELPFWPDWKESNAWRQKLPSRAERRHWGSVFDIVKANEIDSWAYPWTACVWKHGGLTATPNVNLVSNIGFGPDATHTKLADSALAGLRTQGLGVIKHPESVIRDEEADRYTFDKIFEGYRYRFPASIYYSTRKTVGYFARRIKNMKW